MELVVKQLFFTMYNLEEIIELGSKKNIGLRPTMVKDVSKQQFRLKVGEYQDNNNYFKHNLAAIDGGAICWQEIMPEGLDDNEYL